MRILLIGNSYVQAFQKVFKATCPTAHLEDVKREDISPLASHQVEPPDLIIVGNKDLRFAGWLKGVFPRFHSGALAAGGCYQSIGMRQPDSGLTMFG